MSDIDIERKFHRPKAAWTTLGVLFLAYVSSFVDRQVIGLLVEHIKADFQISDTEVSLLLGLSFATFYCLVALPIGRLVDKNYSRFWHHAVEFHDSHVRPRAKLCTTVHREDWRWCWRSNSFKF